MQFGYLECLCQQTLPRTALALHSHYCVTTEIVATARTGTDGGMEVVQDALDDTGRQGLAVEFDGKPFEISLYSRVKDCGCTTHARAPYRTAPHHGTALRCITLQ